MCLFCALIGAQVKISVCTQQASRLEDLSFVCRSRRTHIHRGVNDNRWRCSSSRSYRRWGRVVPRRRSLWVPGRVRLVCRGLGVRHGNRLWCSGWICGRRVSSWWVGPWWRDSVVVDHCRFLRSWRFCCGLLENKCFSLIHSLRNSKSSLGVWSDQRRNLLDTGTIFRIGVFVSVG